MLFWDDITKQVNEKYDNVQSPILVFYNGRRNLILELRNLRILSYIVVQKPKVRFESFEINIYVPFLGSPFFNLIEVA